LLLLSRTTCGLSSFATRAQPDFDGASGVLLALCSGVEAGG
jgi:hypothetical protein